MPKNISGRKFLNHHCLPLHDHFGKFLVGFAHSKKLWTVCVMWKPLKVELGGKLQWFVQKNHERFVSCENHWKLNWVVSCNGLSTCFFVVSYALIVHYVHISMEECVCNPSVHNTISVKTPQNSALTSPCKPEVGWCSSLIKLKLHCTTLVWSVAGGYLFNFLVPWSQWVI
jgi:hypothetical protein